MSGRTTRNSMGMRGVEKEGRHEQMDTEEEVNSTGERGAEDAGPIERDSHGEVDTLLEGEQGEMDAISTGRHVETDNAGTDQMVVKNPNQKKKSKNGNVKLVMKEKTNKLSQASDDFLAGKFKNLRQAAKSYNVSYKTLWAGLVKRGGEFRGKGRFTNRLKAEEEMRVVEHVTWRASIGYGVDWNMLTLLLHEVLLAVKHSNPERETGLENCGQFPPKIWVRRFAERHQLVMRRTMGISKGRQVVSAEELAMWQGDAWKFFSSQPELLAALNVRIISI